MTLLVSGLGLFFAVHLFPRLRATRRAAIRAIGEIPYKLVFTALSLVGLVLIVRGYGAAEFTHLYDPLEQSRAIAHAVMPFAFVLALGSQGPSNMRRYVRHPLAWATLLWGLTHLSANGDVASVVLFGSFAVYAVLHMALANATEVRSNPPRYPRRNDFILVTAGLIAYGVAIWAHGAVFGVRVVG